MKAKAMRLRGREELGLGKEGQPQGARRAG